MTTAMSPARLIPAGLAIVAATYGLARYTYGLFVPDIQQDLGVSTATLGVIASGSYAGYLVATVFGSAISGVVGPRLPVILGGLAAALGMAMMALAEDVTLFACGVILAGTSPGLAYPPLSDAVMRLIAEPRQNRTYAVINSGTSVGVILAAPAALLAASDWRMAWMGFAIFAAVATVWNAFLMPSGGYRCRHGTALPSLHWRWFLGESSTRLFTAAAVFGIATAVYWTFAVDLLVRAGGMAENQSRLFWLLIGAAGLLGGAAGDLVRRIGLRRTFRSGVTAVTLAIAVPAIWPEATGLAYVSGLVFGAGFILVTGLFGIWSVHVFHDRPSAGFGATFFLISGGQLVGPALAGLVASHAGLAHAFLGAAAGCAVAVLLGPRRDVYAMARSPDPADSAEPVPGEVT